MRVRDTWDTIDKYGILVGAIFFFFSFLSLFFSFAFDRQWMGYDVGCWIPDLFAMIYIYINETVLYPSNKSYKPHNRTISYLSNKSIFWHFYPRRLHLWGFHFENFNNMWWLVFLASTFWLLKIAFRQKKNPFFILLNATDVFSTKIMLSLSGCWIYNHNFNIIILWRYFVISEYYFTFLLFNFVPNSHGWFSLVIKTQLITSCVSNTCQKTAPTAMYVQAQRKAS